MAAHYLLAGYYHRVDATHSTAAGRNAGTKLTVYQSLTCEQ